MAEPRTEEHCAAQAAVSSVPMSAMRCKPPGIGCVTARALAGGQDKVATDQAWFRMAYGGTCLLVQSSTYLDTSCQHAGFTAMRVHCRPACAPKDQQLWQFVASWCLPCHQLTSAASAPPSGRQSTPAGHHRLPGLPQVAYAAGHAARACARTLAEWRGSSPVCKHTWVGPGAGSARPARGKAVCVPAMPAGSCVAVLLLAAAAV